MKKIFLFALLMIFILGSVFSQSFGVGGAYTRNNWAIDWDKDVKDLLGSDSDIYDMNLKGYSVFAFAESKYFLALLGLNFFDISFANRDFEKLMEFLVGGPFSMSLTEFSAAVYVKYPISLGQVTIFPLIGIDSKRAFRYTETFDGITETYSGVTAEFSSLWLKGGVGIDIDLTEKLFLRPVFLYGIGTNTNFFNDIQHEVSDMSKRAKNSGYDISLAVGFRRL